MKIAAFIPIKQNSERVKGKNFRQLGDKKLYEYIIENTLKANCFDTIFVDTDSDELMEYVKDKNIEIIQRDPNLATKFANGNDLLVHHQKLYPDYNYYFQLFATAPFMSSETIKICVNKLINSTKHDSIFTGIEKYGFYWMNDVPINYRPGVLPRSQDLTPVIEETTGLYGITKESLTRYNCRIGEYPIIHIIKPREAVDINTEDDFKFAQNLLNKEK